MTSLAPKTPEPLGITPLVLTEGAIHACEKAIHQVRWGKKLFETALGDGFWFFQSGDNAQTCGNAAEKLKAAVIAANQGDMGYEDSRVLCLAIVSRDDTGAQLRGSFYMDVTTAYRAFLEGKFKAGLIRALETAARGLKAMGGSSANHAKVTLYLEDSLADLKVQPVSDSAPGEASSSESGNSTDTK
ncbi:MAG: hypothetical protein IJ228_11040 [Succinivibrio sp.]|nr:hypothetical protein [Succinivibrio sp.]